MTRFHVTAEAACGISVEVDADDEADAIAIAEEAMIDHIRQGCDGIRALIVPERDHGSDRVAGEIEWFDPDDEEDEDRPSDPKGHPWRERQDAE
jgi:hypothetical protein